MYVDAPNLGEHENAVVQLCPVAILLESEAMVAGATFEAWETRLLASLYPREERQISFVQPREHILENVNVDGCILWEFGTNVFDLSFLVITRYGLAIALPGGDTLLQCRVVKIAAAPQHFAQRPLLGGSGPQFLFVGFTRVQLFHRYSFCLISA